MFRSRRSSAFISLSLLNAYFLYNVVFSRKKLTCIYGVGGARSLSGSQGGVSLKKFEKPCSKGLSSFNLFPISTTSNL